MKYTDKLNLINTFSGIALAIIPYLLTLIFNWDEITKTKTEQVFLILTVVVIFILTLITTLEGKKIAKIAGFSYGYFYNFIYEVSDLITDEEAIIVAGGKKYHIQNREGTDTLPLENVKIIIILPNDVYAQYRFCELLRGVMEKAVITPADDAYYSMREKTMNVIEVKENNKYALLLIDTPPTTMRAVNSTGKASTILIIIFPTISWTPENKDCLKKSAPSVKRMQCQFFAMNCIPSSIKFLRKAGFSIIMN